MKNKKFIIFDYDGVLADSLGVALEIFQELQEEYGLPEMKTKEDVRRFHDRNAIEEMKQLGLSEDKIREFLTRVRSSLIEKQDKVKFFPGIAEVVQEFHSRRYVLVIVTSNHSGAVKFFLKKNGLEECFKDIKGGEQEASKYKKFNDLIQKLGMDKKNTHAIGDTMGDISEAKKAGISAVAVSWGWHKKDRLVQMSPDFIFDKPKELLIL